MDIRARDTDRELLLEFSGEMDHHGARNALKEVEIAIDAALPRSLILDFAGVTFMDSSGIGVIIGRTKKLKYFNDSSVSVCNMSDRVDKLLKCAGIYTIVHKL